MTSKTTTTDRPVYGYTVQTWHNGPEYAHLAITLYRFQYTYTGSDGRERETWDALCNLTAQANARKDGAGVEDFPQVTVHCEKEDRRQDASFGRWYSFEIEHLHGSGLESQFASAVELKALNEKAGKIVDKYNLRYKFRNEADCFVAGLNRLGVRYLAHDANSYKVRTAQEREVPYAIRECK